MKHVTILVPNGEGNNLSSIVGAYKILMKANEYWIKMGHPSKLHIDLAGTSSNTSFHQGLFSVHPNKNIAEIEYTDLIIIPSLNHQYNEALQHNQAIADWILYQYEKGAEIASICTGAFLLASTGILNGRVCSTHWSVKENFQQMFPAVDLQTDALITDEQGIYTNGGAYSFLNLMIYLIEKYFNRETALFCAKVFQIDINRNSQSEFIIFSSQKNHQDPEIKSAQLYIEKNVDIKFSIEDLCNRFLINRRNFDRRFLKATGNSPLEYIQRVKMEAVKKELENSRKTINEIMYDVGYTDPKSFRETFKKITGLSPMEYKTKYSKSFNPIMG